MSYIDKNSNTVISARLTNEGRLLLSLGLLNFDTFRLGDSNIDYTTLGPTYDITLENIIRAKAENPDIKTPILPTANATNTYVSMPSQPPVILQTLINAPRIGFFEYGSGTTIEYTAYTDTICHTLQSDTVIPLAGLTGGTSIPIRQSGTYGSNTYEPKVGDLLMVKMSNDELTLPQVPNVVDLTVPVPYLWFQVQEIESGTLSADTLQIIIDRDFASFPSYVGANEAQVIFYPLGTGTTKDSLFSDGGFFSGGCVWNMNNVWSYPIPGVNPATHETFDDYGSETYIGTKEYFGYTSEINYLYTANTACNIVPSVSLIHYTNKETCENQSELKYGQKFYIDTTIPDSPKLILPTLMWHKEYSATTIGQVFSGSGSMQYVTMSGTSLYPAPQPNSMEKNVYYYDLVDKYTNKVGRIYPELHMFSIDNQELVAALSYKSNRNWTLPTASTQLGGLVNGVVDGTEVVYITYMLESTSGYTSGLHCQNIVCVTTEDCDCNPIDSKTIKVTLPNEFPYMTVTGGTGWYADKFYILAQKQPLGTYPDPTQWRLMDYTSDIVGHIVGDRIDPNDLVASEFEITNSDYLSGTTYDLSNFIKIPQIAESNYLQFGDERFLYGNVEATGVTNKYRTKFVFAIPPTMFNWSTNPTWPSSGQKVHIDEIHVYGSPTQLGNRPLVAVGKTNLPIEKITNATILIEIAFDL